MAGKKFRFSLETVLKLRRHETERARQHLGRTARERREQEEHVRHMQHRLMTFAGVAVARVVDSISLQRKDAFRKDARQRYEKARTELATRKQYEGQARETLQKKHGAAESLQILCEKEEALHKKEQQDAEGAFLDEQAISGFSRKRTQ